MVRLSIAVGSHEAGASRAGALPASRAALSCQLLRRRSVLLGDGPTGETMSLSLGGFHPVWSVGGGRIHDWLPDETK
jgi:hypothetical protein